MTQDAERAQQWMADLAQQPLAPVTLVPARGMVFINETIEGQRFCGRRDGDTLFLAGPGCEGELGVTAINHVAPWSGGSRVAWRLCKYGNQGHGSALQLSDAGLRALAVTFGLPVVPLLRAVGVRQLHERMHFYASPAFTALHAWATEAPGRVTDSVGDSYLGLWPLAALEGEQVPSSKENIERVLPRLARLAGAARG
jgi:hypothetical protein